MHRSIPEIIKVKSDFCCPLTHNVHIGLLFLLCKAPAAIAQSAVSLIMGRRGRNEDETSCETSQTGCRGSSLPCSLLQLCIHYSATIQLTMRSLLTNIHYSASDQALWFVEGCSGENSCRQRFQHYGIREILGQG